ncbi:MAG: hypothetical protein AAFQ38_16880, partial [Pseudomonadota bacterium]
RRSQFGAEKAELSLQSSCANQQAVFWLSVPFQRSLCARVLKEGSPWPAFALAGLTKNERQKGPKLPEADKKQ